jgi:hypothetical protein
VNDKGRVTNDEVGKGVRLLFGRWKSCLTLFSGRLEVVLRRTPSPVMLGPSVVKVRLE